MKSQQQPKYIVSGGGTGGHIFPAIAIASELKNRQPDADILFVGAEGRMEMEKVPAAGFPIVGLPVSGFQRRVTSQNLLFPVRLLRSLWKAWSIVKTYQPSVVVGVGGYASGPVMQCAAWQKVPIVIQEQNSHAGVTNRLVAKKADKICVAWENMEQYFPASKIVLTGNPVRASIVDKNLTKEEALKQFGLKEGIPVLLITGGSLGARSINQSMEKNLSFFINAGLNIIWQTGKSWSASPEQVMEENPGRVWCGHFIENMAAAYAAADLVVARAGALSISELCIVGKPAILIPSPNVAEDHQRKNAQALAGKKAALMVEDKTCGERLPDAVMKIIQDPTLAESLSKNIAALAKPNAARDIVNQIFSVVR